MIVDSTTFNRISIHLMKCNKCMLHSLFMSFLYCSAVIAVVSEKKIYILVKQ